VGCSAEQIEQVATDNGHPLPAAYFDFLKRAGWTWPLSGGYSVIFPQIAHNKETALSLFEEMGVAVSLLERAIVFFEHGGYIIYYVNDGEGEDPPVYRYQDDMAGPELRFPRYSEWLLWFIDTLQKLSPGRVGGSY
jgi:hypothetical protein